MHYTSKRLDTNLKAHKGELANLPPLRWLRIASGTNRLAGKAPNGQICTLNRLGTAVNWRGQFRLEAEIYQ
jgi:hypothetical protein